MHNNRKGHSLMTACMYERVEVELEIIVKSIALVCLRIESQIRNSNWSLSFRTMKKCPMAKNLRNVIGVILNSAPLVDFYCIKKSAKVLQKYQLSIKTRLKKSSMLRKVKNKTNATKPRTVLWDPR